MEIVFEDNHHLVAFKPAGIATQRNGIILGFEDDVKSFIKKRDSKEGGVFLEPIHRLDAPVSGLILFAKSKKALSRLQAQMREKKIGRKYLAQVEGIMKGSGHLEHFLLKESYIARVVPEGTPGAKKAVLDYNVSGQDVEITLVTGRYHQIRAQLAAFGHPILGDVKYGASKEKENISLVCVELSFFHITENKLITATLPL